MSCVSPRFLPAVPNRTQLVPLVHHGNDGGYWGTLGVDLHKQFEAHRIFKSGPSIM
jgi:hypothetical protein